MLPFNWLRSCFKLAVSFFAEANHYRCCGAGLTRRNYNRHSSHRLGTNGTGPFLSPLYWNVAGHFLDNTVKHMYIYIYIYMLFNATSA